MEVKVKKVSFSIRERQIISDIYLQAKPGQTVGIIGPNGSGKSTLLKNIYRVLQPDSGVILLNDKEIERLSNKQTAQELAVVSQEAPVFFEFSVREIVLMGRAPHKRMLESTTSKDEKVVKEALQRVGMEHFADRSITTLSGGEKQRVLLARALAQQARVLILDEPTNHLDVHHQLQLMDLIKTLNNTVLAALHDLNTASYYCDQIYVMHRGKIVASGAPEEVLTEKLLKDVFRVNSRIIRHPVTDKTHITFLPGTL